MCHGFLTSEQREKSQSFQCRNLFIPRSSNHQPLIGTIFVFLTFCKIESNTTSDWLNCMV